MSNILYVNPKGYNVTRHSHSASDVLNFCPRKYDLEKRGGWVEREKKAAMEFGSTVEAGVRVYHEDESLVHALQAFHKAWNVFKGVPMIYAKTEVSWDNLNDIGVQMLRLYDIKVGTFPYELRPIKFQVNERKPIAELPGIELTAYIDMICCEKETRDRLILDCKVSGMELPDYISLDPQLQTYSYLNDCRKVGFLWFQKMNVAIEKGSECTVLSDISGDIAAGTTVWALSTYTEADGTVKVYVTKNEDRLAEMEKLFPTKGKQTAGKSAAREAWIMGKGILVPRTILTKQKVYVRVANVSERLANDRYRSLVEDAMRIHYYNDQNFFPMHGGVRFPNAKCPTCPMRGICSGDEELRDKLVMREDV